MNRAQRQQARAIQELFRGAAHNGAVPNAGELDELLQLRLPKAAVEEVSRLAAGIAKMASTTTDKAQLQRLVSGLPREVVTAHAEDTTELDSEDTAAVEAALHRAMKEPR